MTVKAQIRARQQFLKALMEITVFWGMTLCSVVVACNGNVSGEPTASFVRVEY
jgi:hypothetical protein